MTGHVIPKQQIEKNYINSLLNATHKDVGSAENAGRNFQLDSQQQAENEAVEIATDISAEHNAGVTENGLYQLILVDGLKLAIPFAEITQAVDHSNTVIKNDILFHNGEHFTIIKLAAMIRPQDKVLDVSTDSKQYLLIQHRQLAVECQKILEIETINEDLVCWRNDSSQRKWLAGTVKQQGIAILDLTTLQKMLLVKAGV